MRKDDHLSGAVITERPRSFARHCAEGYTVLRNQNIVHTPKSSLHYQEFAIRYGRYDILVGKAHNTCRNGLRNDPRYSEAFHSPGKPGARLCGTGPTVSLQDI